MLPKPLPRQTPTTQECVSHSSPPRTKTMATGKRKREQAKLDKESRSGFNNPDAPLGIVDTAKEDDFDVGPLSVLKKAVVNEAMVLINVRNNKKLLAKVKAFDRHCNMVLTNVTEIWYEYAKSGKGAKTQRTEKTRTISKMFLRGDSVVLVLLNPK